jgi:hypothetical protein
LLRKKPGFAGLRFATAAAPPRLLAPLGRHPYNPLRGIRQHKRGALVPAKIVFCGKSWRCCNFMYTSNYTFSAKSIIAAYAMYRIDKFRVICLDFSFNFNFANTVYTKGIKKNKSAHCGR